MCGGLRALLPKIADHSVEINVWHAATTLSTKEISFLLSTSAYLFSIESPLLTVHANLLYLLDGRAALLHRHTLGATKR
jgi:hypothetical protein